MGLPALASFENTEVTAFFGEILKSGLSLRVRVTGRSMAPFLKGGEVVTIKQAAASDLRRGDLILFDSPHGVQVLHRLVRKKRGAGGSHIYQTRGDALRTLDGPITSNEILGRVCSIEHNHPTSGGRRTEMGSALQRTINYLLAVINLAESFIYCSVAGRSTKGC
ncbi:MAG: signal peptidase I [Nitrospirae bacterium]|nr:signal peptidase I [Nitrospirota bacterium]